MNANSSASGIVTATISPDRTSKRKKISTTTTSTMPRSRLSSTVRVVIRDQLAAVVERDDLHVLRQDASLSSRGLRLDALEHHLRLLAGAHQDDAFDGVVRCHEAELPEPRRVADHDLADVLHEHRDAVLHRDDDVADVLERLDAAEAAHVVELAALGVESAAGVAVVRPRAPSATSPDRQTRRRRARVGSSSTWYCIVSPPSDDRSATPGTDLYCRSSTQSWMDLELHRRAIRALQHVAVDQPARREQRRHAGRDAVGHARRRGTRSNTCCAREVVVGVVLEDESDVGQPVERDRAHDVEVRAGRSSPSRAGS